MRGTKLWQDAGSPLIRGRSRAERSFSRDWMTATAVGFLAGCAVAAAFLVYKGAPWETALRTVWLPALPASFIGAAIGVPIARQFGWRRRWVTGAVVAVVLAVAATLAFTVYLLSKLGS